MLNWALVLMSLSSLGTSLLFNSKNTGHILESILYSHEASAAEVANQEYQNDQKWHSFKTKHRKTYKDNKEELNRYKIFKDNLAKIDQMNDENEKINGHRPFGINEFTDLDPNEFATGFLNYNRGQEARAMDAPVMNSQAKYAAILPTQIDWSTTGATTPVKNQGACGSCWAFSATEQLETAIYMSTGVLPTLSPQQVTSCSTANAGCNGGDTVSAYSYMMSAGLESEQSYPYTSGSTGSTGSCKYDPNAVTARMQGWSYGVAPCSYKDSSCSAQPSLEPTLQQSVANQGPASVCLNATPWQYYTGGILAANCASDLYSMNHCVQLVGYNVPSTGSSYWILRNQWGTNWGNKGFIYLSMGSNQCGLANEVTYVNAGPISTPTPLPSPTPSTSPSPTPTATPTPQTNAMISISPQNGVFTYNSRRYATFTVKFTNNSQPVVNTNVSVVISGPVKMSTTGNTRSSGYFQFSILLNSTLVRGTYKITATGLTNGTNVIGTTQFTVK